MTSSDSNELFLAVLPTVSLSGTERTDQIMTLLPDRNFASTFFEDEVEDYIQLFRKKEHAFSGGHVSGYDCLKEKTDTGRFIVRVTQHVQ